jgi:hypothetical protein
MPFKTRKQKESADRKRISFTSNGTVSYGTTTQSHAKTETATVETSKQKRIGENYADFKREILKITVLAAVILTLQAILKITKFSI